MEKLTRFVVEKVTDNVGQKVDTLVKYTMEDNSDEQREEWTSIPELDQLFDTCVRRWPDGWDLEKLLTCIRECEFD